MASEASRVRGRWPRSGKEGPSPASDLRSSAPSPARGEGFSSNRLMHRDQLGAVGKRRLDLNLGDHLGDAVHDLYARKDVGAAFHQLGDGAAVARAFEDEVGDQRDGFRMVELDP